MIEIVSYNWDSSRIADLLAWKPNKNMLLSLISKRESFIVLFHFLYNVFFFSEAPAAVTLTAGEVAGVVVCILVLIVLVAMLTIFIMRRKYRNRGNSVTMNFSRSVSIFNRSKESVP